MATAAELRSRAVDLMTSRTGMNSYTQGGNRIYFFGKPDNVPGNTTQKGFSDCSSAVRAAIKAVTGIDIGANTSAQINNRKTKGMVVHETTGYYPDESKLLPGDCLYFKGNASHPLDVGHVEMYIGNGRLCGHGSGTGPKIKKLKDYCTSRANSKKRYFMAIRWIQDGAEGEPEPGNLKLGMNDNEAVKTLQQNLLLLGYDVGQYGTSGDFDTGTRDAVLAFQRNNGLSADGIVGTKTQAAIAKALEGLSDSDETEMPPIPSVNAVTINTGTWNVRTGPSTEYPSAGFVSGGDKLEKVDANGWIPVMFNGEVRWIGPSAVKK